MQALPRKLASVRRAVDPRSFCIYLNFFCYFLKLFLLDPDPGGTMNANPSGSTALGVITGMEDKGGTI